MHNDAHVAMRGCPSHWISGGLDCRRHHEHPHTPQSTLTHPPPSTWGDAVLGMCRERSAAGHCPRAWLQAGNSAAGPEELMGVTLTVRETTPAAREEAFQGHGEGGESMAHVS